MFQAHKAEQQLDALPRGQLAALVLARRHPLNVRHAAHLAARVAVRDRRQSLPMMASLVRRLANDGKVEAPFVENGFSILFSIEKNLNTLENK